LKLFPPDGSLFRFFLIIFYCAVVLLSQQVNAETALIQAILMNLMPNVIGTELVAAYVNFMKVRRLKPVMMDSVFGLAVLCVGSIGMAHT
jgi:mannose/fructose/N-acetylgalactosamine-specific phosphotransferase system component IID